MGEVSLRISLTAGPDDERGTLLHLTDDVCGFGNVIKHSKPAVRGLVQSISWCSGENRNVGAANTDRHQKLVHVQLLS